MASIQLPTTQLTPTVLSTPLKCGEEHKGLLKAEGNTNVEARHADKFPRWFENCVKELELILPIILLSKFMPCLGVLIEEQNNIKVVQSMVIDFT
ncbi:hypothetical protein LguiB_027250 [Lonicera macranthoides]